MDKKGTVSRDGVYVCARVHLCAHLRVRVAVCKRVCTRACLFHCTLSISNVCYMLGINKIGHKLSVI